ncbi:MAG: N-6 DNA methylase [Deltaproteobacteria bacterium]|nr:N-6 DNA methylase [Deltaproteobacteria bacterium]
MAPILKMFTDLFHDLLEKLFSFSTPEIQNSSKLSVELAKRTRFLEHLLREELVKWNEEVTRLFKAFQEELIETLTRERFADLYAQTITYGLFAARMKALDEFKKETAWKFIPQSLPLLKEIFYFMMGPHFPESLSWIVDDISQVLEKEDIPSILKEFKTTRWDEDPVIHFYETFLANYNPKERERLGVYYTALPGVSYIVRSIHELLKNKFGKSEGLATRDVTLLDPTAGTLTFVVQAIKQVQDELEARKERNIQPLSDDYIKFIRFAHWKIAQAGKGILGFVTNNSYLSGIIHPGNEEKTP